MTNIAKLTDKQMKGAIPARLRKRLIQGRFESGEDIVLAISSWGWLVRYRRTLV